MHGCARKWAVRVMRGRWAFGVSAPTHRQLLGATSARSRPERAAHRQLLGAPRQAVTRAGRTAHMANAGGRRERRGRRVSWLRAVPNGSVWRAQSAWEGGEGAACEPGAGGVVRWQGPRRPARVHARARVRARVCVLAQVLAYNHGHGRVRWQRTWAWACPRPCARAYQPPQPSVTPQRSQHSAADRTTAHGIGSWRASALTPPRLSKKRSICPAFAFICRCHASSSIVDGPATPSSAPDGVRGLSMDSSASTWHRTSHR